MKIIRLMLMAVAVTTLVLGGMYGCAKKTDTGTGGMETTMPSDGMQSDKDMDGAGGRSMDEAPPGPKEMAEPVEPARDVMALKDVYFDFDSFAINSSQTAVLEDNAKWMKDNPNTIITVEGHCDERGTVEYNLALGERRAKAAKDYVVTLGVDSSRIKTISYGKSKPADPGSGESAWAKNRRAHFVVQ